MPQYKATVFIRGAAPQHFYGTSLKGLAARATKALTIFEPGTGNLMPMGFTIYEHVRTVSGNRATWSALALSTVQYKDVPQQQEEWRKQALRHMAGLLKVVHEPSDLRRKPSENCIDCHKATRYWVTATNTPLCPACCAIRNVNARAMPVHKAPLTFVGGKPTPCIVCGRNTAYIMADNETPLCPVCASGPNRHA